MSSAVLGGRPLTSQCLHRPLGGPGEHAQLAGLPEPVLRLPQPLDERRIEDVRDDDPVCGEHRAQPERFLAIPRQLGAEGPPVLGQERVTGLVTDVAQPRARDLGQPFHFRVAPGREGPQPVVAAGDGPIPVVHGTVQGHGPMPAVRPAARTARPDRLRTGSRSAPAILGAGIRPVHTDLADQPGELREFPPADRAGATAGRDQVIDVAERGLLGSHPPGSFGPGRRLTGRPPSRKALHLRLTGGKQFLRRRRRCRGWPSRGRT